MCHSESTIYRFYVSNVYFFTSSCNLQVQNIIMASNETIIIKKNIFYSKMSRSNPWHRCLAIDGNLLNFISCETIVSVSKSSTEHKRHNRFSRELLLLYSMGSDLKASLNKSEFIRESTLLAIVLPSNRETSRIKTTVVWWEIAT